MKPGGFALLTGLLFLAALTLLALVATCGMTMQRHQATNFQARAQALAYADLASSAALAWLLSRPDTERERDCRDDCLLPPGIAGSDTIPPDAEFRGTSWWQANGQASGLHPLDGEPLPGRGHLMPGASIWLLEEIHYQTAAELPQASAVEGLAWYRILARGSARNPGSVVVTESIVARPWGGEYQPAAFPPQEGSAAFCRQFADRLPCGVRSWRQRR
jgi:hypothetical protein